MEFLFFIVLALAVGAIFLSNARRAARKINWFARKPFGKRSRRIAPKFRPNPTYRKHVFDTQTSEVDVAGTVLEGVARIIDGDSLVIAGKQVRLYGVDAPELEHPYGQKAKWALVALCKGQTVRAEVTAQDAYGRPVALCSLADGRDISAEMVKQGLAIDWAKFSDGEYRKLEPDGTRKRLWLADARQRGRMDVWERFEAQRKGR